MASILRDFKIGPLFWAKLAILDLPSLQL